MERSGRYIRNVAICKSINNCKFVKNIKNDENRN